MQKRRKIKIVFKTDATSISNYFIVLNYIEILNYFFLFYSLSTNVFQLEENVSKSPEKRNPQGLSIVFV